MKTLHLLIIAVFLGFTCLMLLYNNSVYGIWIRQSPQELFNESSTIFVGNITSTNVLQLEKELRYTTQVNGTDKNIVQNYTLTLDEYNVRVEEFLKNPQNTNKILVRQPTIGLPSGLGGLDQFKTGDRVLFYVKNLDGINEYSPESFVIPKSCVAKDVLTQKRLESRGESIIIQNGIKVDNNFTANKPIRIIYNEDVDTLSGKNLDFQVYITKTLNNGAEVVFNKEIHAVAKPCEWTTSAEWEFTPQEGEYAMAVRIIEDNATYSQYYGKFSVKSNVITSDHISPLKQFKSGIKSNDVKCNNDLQLIFKIEDNSPACVKINTIFRLSETGWGYLLSPFITKTDLLNSKISGGIIKEFQYDLQSASVIIKIQTVSDGSLIITIPKIITDLNPSHKPFKDFHTILVDGMEETVNLMPTANGSSFTVPFTNGTQEIEIIGNQVG